MKSKISALWNKLDLFCKISAISLAVVVVLTIIAIILKNALAIVFSILQLAGLIVALLVHKDVIKMNHKMKWIRYFILAVAIILTYTNIASYFWTNKNVEDNSSLNQPQTSYTSSISDTSDDETKNMIPFPVGATDCVSYDYTALKTELYDVGYTNIRTNEIQDLAPSEENKVGSVDNVTVNGQTDFTKGQEFKYDDEIIISYHYYAKCKVTVHVDFLSNLVFSRYNVNVQLDGLNKGTLEHGTDGDFEFAVTPGNHTITFESAETSTVNGEATMNVDSDIDVSYQISCYNDKVSVTELYFDRLVEVPNGQVKVDVAASDYKYKNKTDVESALKTLGFTNIKYDIIYDIVFGITQEGEVEKVTIAGTSDFKRGDVFAADAEIVIAYHMKKEDNPNRVEETSSDTSNPTDIAETTPNLTIENNSTFASLMQITDQTDAATIKDFVNAYKGDTIEFDGCIAFMMKHENYNTRFDVCMAGGNYNADRVYGPLFAFENVNYYDMNVSGTDTVAQGMNFRITAKIKGFSDSGGYIILEPVSLVSR